MSKYIDISRLVSADLLAQVDQIEKLGDVVTTSNVRGVEISYSTCSRRQLWQAVGHEYIESEMLDFIDDIPVGSVYYDIGASNGIFALYAALKGLKVYCFEPEAQNFSLLEKNVYLNYAKIPEGCRCFNVALSDASGLGQMFVAAYEAAGHMKILDKAQKVQEKEEFTPEYVQAVLKFSLDDFIDFTKVPPPQYLKVDVDGSELPLVMGATRQLKGKTLKKIFIELDMNGDASKVILDRLGEFGFCVESKVQVQNYQGLYNLVLSR